MPFVSAVIHHNALGGIRALKPWGLSISGEEWTDFCVHDIRHKSFLRRGQQRRCYEWSGGCTWFTTRDVAVLKFKYLVAQCLAWDVACSLCAVVSLTLIIAKVHKFEPLNTAVNTFLVVHDSLALIRCFIVQLDHRIHQTQFLGWCTPLYYHQKVAAIFDKKRNATMAVISPAGNSHTVEYYCAVLTAAPRTEQLRFSAHVQRFTSERCDLKVSL